MGILFINDLAGTDGVFNISEIEDTGTTGLDFTFDVSGIAGVADGDVVVINSMPFVIPAGTVAGTGMFVINFGTVSDGVVDLDWIVTDTSDGGATLAMGDSSIMTDLTAPNLSLIHI